MFSYLVTSRTRRRLLELLWRHAASGSVSELAARARVAFSSAYRELKLMEDFGLVVARVDDGREVYAAAVDHPDADLMHRVVASKARAEPPSDSDATNVRRRVRALGAPLPVSAVPVPAAERERVLVDAVRLAHRDATLARVLPVAFWAQRDKLDRRRLKMVAARSRETHAVGFLLALTAELADDDSMRRWSTGFRDHRVKTVRPFFDLPSVHATRELAERRTPEVARKWGYLMDLDLESFKAAFAKHGA